VFYLLLLLSLVAVVRSITQKEQLSKISPMNSQRIRLFQIFTFCVKERSMKKRIVTY